MLSPRSRRTIGSLRSFAENSFGGLRGWSNIASWAVVGTLAYFLWVKPARDLKAEQEKATLAVASDPDLNHKWHSSDDDSGYFFYKLSEN